MPYVMTEKHKAALRKANKARAGKKRGSYKVKRIKKSPEIEHDTEKEVSENQIAFAFGYLSAWIEGYANRTGVSKRTLASKLARLIQNSAVR